MSALGQHRTWRDQIAMSALPPKADILRRYLNVRFVPTAEVADFYSIILSALTSIGGGSRRPSNVAVLRLAIS
jgi:hypothetical protein